MSITIHDLITCEPTIGGCSSCPEPNLRDVLISYYRPFYTTKMAEKLADEYLYALKNHLNTARRML